MRACRMYIKPFETVNNSASICLMTSSLGFGNVSALSLDCQPHSKANARKTLRPLRPQCLCSNDRMEGAIARSEINRRCLLERMMNSPGSNFATFGDVLNFGRFFYGLGG